MINVYVANLGKYNEGILVGEWATLPITNEEKNELMNRIGINEAYEEYFIADCELSEELNGMVEIEEYSNLDKLNELALQLNELDNNEIEIIGAIMRTQGYEDLEDAINNRDNFTYLYLNDMCNEKEDLAYSYIESVYGGVENMDREDLEQYCDYETLKDDLKFDLDIIIEDEEEREAMTERQIDRFLDEYIEDIGIECFSNIADYFDYELFGRDLSCECSIDYETNIVIF